jgi:nitrite reductase/ring-hydroxylating ferredoxin subunit
MEQFVKLCEIDEVAPGSSKALEIEGRKIALFHVDGAWHALENACPHRGRALSAGQLAAGTVTCPLHGWRFDLHTGSQTGGTGPGVRTYSLRVENDGVFVSLEPASPGTARDDESRVGSSRPVPCLIRYGTMGLVGWFTCANGGKLHRGTRVVVETPRGIEAGEVLTMLPDRAVIPQGQVLRTMTQEDELQERALREKDDSAFQSCRALLRERAIPVELMDVEQLLDGETVLFYFLGELPEDMSGVTDELARLYEARVEFHDFARRVEEGCGPGCGTDEGAGCGSCSAGGCATGGCGTSCAVQEQRP